MKNGKKDGTVIPNYYPAVVTETEWLLARSGRQKRTKMRGRVGKRVNIFAGLLRCGLDGGPYHLNSWKTRNRTQLVLVNFRATEGLGSARSFPYETLEVAILSALKELDPQDLFGEANDEPEKLSVLTEQQVGVEAELIDLAADMDANGYSPTLATRVRGLEAQQRDLAERIVDARGRVASPAIEGWDEVKSLSGLIATSPDPTDLRLRLQAALRRIVTEARIVVVPRPPFRLAAVSLYFGNGPDAPFRSFFIIHQPASAPRGKLIHPTRWVCLTLHHPEDGLPFNNDDLRNVDEANCVEAGLQKHPRDMIEELLSSQSNAVNFKRG